VSPRRGGTPCGQCHCHLAGVRAQHALSGVCRCGGSHPQGVDCSRVGQGWHGAMPSLQGTSLFGFQLSLWAGQEDPMWWWGDRNPRLGLWGQGLSPLGLGTPQHCFLLGRLAKVSGWPGPEGRWHSTCISHRPAACQHGDAGGPCAGAACCSHAAGSTRLGSAAELTSVVWQEEPPRGCPCPAPQSRGGCPRDWGCFSGEAGWARPALAW